MVRGIFLAVLGGVVLGAGPNPMGTIKDAVVLYGEHGIGGGFRRNEEDNERNKEGNE